MRTLTTDFPSAEEEFDRKTLTELERVMHGLAVRKVSLVSAAASLQTMWQMVAGLIPKETMELLAQSSTAVSQKLKTKAIPDNLAFLIGGPGGVIVLRRDADIVAVQMWVGNSNSNKEFRPPADAIHPELWASDEFAKLLANFNQRGFALAFQQ